jgi:hypothetical protein
VFDVGRAEILFQKLFTIGAAFLTEVNYDTVLAGGSGFLDLCIQITQADFEPVGINQLFFEHGVVKLQKLIVFVSA